MLDFLQHYNCQFNENKATVLIPEDCNYNFDEEKILLLVCQVSFPLYTIFVLQPGAILEIEEKLSR